MAEETKPQEQTPPVEPQEQQKPQPTEPKPEPPKVEEKPIETPKPQPDNSAEVAELKEKLLGSEIEKAGLMQALSLGLDVKTAPYVLKLADLSNVADKNGKINDALLQGAIKKVLDEVPALKPSEAQQNGFVIGGNGNNTPPTKTTKQTVPSAQKRWNRFN